MGIAAISAIVPKPPVLFVPMASATPVINGKMNDTAMAPVAVPPASKAIDTNKFSL